MSEYRKTLESKFLGSMLGCALGDAIPTSES